MMRSSSMMVYALIVFFFLSLLCFVAVGAAPNTGPSSCSTSSQSLPSCLPSVFPDPAQATCVVRILGNTTLMSATRCMTTDPAEMPCNRTQWRMIASCTDCPSQLFQDETHCLRVSTTAACKGSLAGMCGDYFGFPRRNCSEMPEEFRSAPCPVTNVIQICDACHKYITNVAIRYYAQLGVTSANSFSKVVYFDADSSVYTTFDQLFADLSPLVQQLSCRIFLTSSNFLYFDDLTRAYPDAFIVATLDAALPSTTVPPNYFYLSGRMDLLTYIAGATTIAQSKSKIAVWLSNETVGESALRRALFMGMASAVHRYGGPSAAPFFLRTQQEAVFLSGLGNTTSLVSDVFLSLSAAAIFPFMKRAYSMGLITDFLTDSLTFAHTNSIESRNLLGSVTADLLGPVRALFAATARGFFQSGVFTGDVSSIFLVPCVYSCPTLTSSANTSERRSFSETLNLQFDLNIDYNFFERTLPHEDGFAVGGHIDFVPLSTVMTGVDAMLLEPQILFLTPSTVVILNLENFNYPVLMFSMQLLHIQPALWNASAARVALAGRVGYASAVDPVSGQVFVSMGRYRNGTLVAGGDIWSVNVPWSFHLIMCWTQLNKINSSSSVIVPSPRSGHSLLFARDALYLFGGYGCAANCNNDTWMSEMVADRTVYQFSISTKVWVALSPPAPSSVVFPTGVNHTIGFVVNGSSMPLGGVISSTWLMYAGGSGASFDVAAFNVEDHSGGSGPGRWQFLNAGPGRSSAVLANVTVVCAALIKTPSAMILVAGSAREGFLFSLDLAYVERFTWSSLPTSTSCAASYNSQLQTEGLSTVVVLHSGMSRSNRSVKYLDVTQRAICRDGNNDIYSYSQLQCYSCGSVGAQAVNGRCLIPSSADNTLQIVAECVFSSLVVITALLAFRAYKTHKRLQLLLNGDRIAEKLAGCVAKMDFNELAFLHAAVTDNPTRLQRAFLDILDVLSIYLLFVPSWVRDGDQLVPPSATPAAVLKRRRTSIEWMSSSTATIESLDRFSDRYRGAGSKPTENDRHVLRYLQSLPAGKLFRSQIAVLTIRTHNLIYAQSTYEGSSDVETKAFSQLLGRISELADLHTGLVEWVSSDVVIVSFNGLRANARGLLSAATMAHRISQEESHCSGGAETSSSTTLNTVNMHCGIAVGVATVGVVGRVNGLHSFIDGGMVKDSDVLSKMAVALRLGVLLRHSDASRIKNHVCSRICRRAQVAPPPQQRELVSSVMAMTSDISPVIRSSHEAANEVLEALHAGKVLGARSLLDTHESALTSEDLAIVSAAVEATAVPVL